MSHVPTIKFWFSSMVGFAGEFVQNPFRPDRIMHWAEYGWWVKRPAVLLTLMVPSALFILWRCGEHHRFVRSVYEAWEHMDGVRCGTGIGISEYLTASAALFLPTALGVIGIAAWGLGNVLGNGNIGSEYRGRGGGEVLPVLCTWILGSVVWPVWLILVFVGSTSVMDRYYGGHVWDDYYTGDWYAHLAVVALYFFGAWLGLAVPAVTVRLKHAGRYRWVALGFLLSGAVINARMRIPFENETSIFDRLEALISSELIFMGVGCLLSPFLVRSWFRRTIA